MITTQRASIIICVVALGVFHLLQCTFADKCDIPGSVYFTDSIPENESAVNPGQQDGEEKAVGAGFKPAPTKRKPRA